MCCILQIQEQLQPQSYSRGNLVWPPYFVITFKNTLLNIVSGMLKKNQVQVGRFPLNSERVSGELEFKKKLFYFYLHPIKR